MNATLISKEKTAVKLSFEVSAEVLEQGMAFAYNKHKNNLSLPGFRKGKVPRKLIEAQYGEGFFYEDAINHIFPDEYMAAVKELGLDVVSAPTLDIDYIQSGKGAKFICDVTVKPEVELGQYKGLEVEKVSAEVTDEDVMKELEKVQKQNARKVEVTDRAAQLGDVVNIDYLGSVDGVAFDGGKAEGFETEVHNIAFDGLIPSLQSGVIDTAINDITITPDREKSVDFSKRYYIAGLGVVVKADNDAIKTADDLKGKVLGVTIGSTGEEAARKIEGANVKVYNTLSDAFLDLKQGAVDAVVNDIPTNEYYVAKTSDHSVKTAPVALTSEDLGIAVKKGNKDLLKKIDDGLAKIKKNGEFAAIYKKWFDREPPAELLK